MQKFLKFSGILTFLLLLMVEPHLCFKSGRSFGRTMGKSKGRNMQGATGRVVGGGEVYPFQYPWTVNIKSNGVHKCGGVLLNKKLVLTAATCALEGPNPLTVTALDHNILCEEGTEEIQQVIEVVRYGRFNATGKEENNVAVLRISNEFSSSRLDVPEFPKVYAYKPDPAQNGTFVGWGILENRPQLGASATLQSAELQQLALTQCNTFYGGTLTENTICFNDTGKGACDGDMGGPVMCNPINKDDPAILCGIVSNRNNDSCGIKPSVATLLTGDILNWTLRIKEKNPTSSGRSESRTPFHLEIDVAKTCGGELDTNATTGAFILKDIQPGTKCHWLLTTVEDTIIFHRMDEQGDFQKNDSFIIVGFCKEGGRPCAIRHFIVEDKEVKIEGAGTYLVMLELTTTFADVKRNVLINFTISGSEHKNPKPTKHLVLNGAPPGNFSYPEKGGNYSDDEHVIVLFKPYNPGYLEHMNITITKVDIESDGNTCLHDAFIFYRPEGEDFKEVHWLCGNQLPPKDSTFTVPHGLGVGLFITDRKDNATGFSFSYQLEHNVENDEKQSSSEEDDGPQPLED